LRQLGCENIDTLNRRRCRQQLGGLLPECGGHASREVRVPAAFVRKGVEGRAERYCGGQSPLSIHWMSAATGNIPEASGHPADVSNVWSQTIFGRQGLDAGRRRNVSGATARRTEHRLTIVVSFLFS
jgi:hypothetical protein